jgi:hypothetical protein
MPSRCAQAHAWRPGPQSPNHDTSATRKAELLRRLVGLVSKQRPRIRARDTSAPVRPTREAFVEAMTRDPKSSAHTPYPRVPRAPLRADPYFSPRAGTELNQITPSYGVGEAHRYGRGDVFNVGSLGDAGVPGAHLDVEMRPRQGETPAPSRGSRRRPPRYGTKNGAPGAGERSGPRTTRSDTHLFVEQQSETSENQFRKPLLVGNVTQPRSRRPPSRRQGYLKQAASSNIQGALHAARYLGNLTARHERRKRKRIARLMAKRVELMCLHDVLSLPRRQEIAKLQAQLTALRATHDVLTSLQPQSGSTSAKFVAGYHNDSSLFDVWKVATELVQQQKTQQQPVTMKGLR